MNSSLLLLLILFLFNAEISAQKNKVRSIDWKVVGSLPSLNGRSEALGLGGPVIGLSNELLIVAGGSNFPDSMPWQGGKKKYYDQGYIFKKVGEDSLEYLEGFKLPSALGYAANCTTPAGIVAAGGENENEISKKVFLIGWDGNSQTIIIKNLPDLPFAVTNASVTEHNSKLYLAGGETVNGVSDQFLLLDLNEENPAWRNLPPLPKPVSHAVMLVQSNKENTCVYVFGGRKKNVDAPSDLYASTLRFNLQTNQWSPGKALPYSLSAGTGIATPTRYIVLFGGDAGETFHRTEELVVAINKETDPVKRQQLDLQKQYVQSSHPGFCRQVLLYDTKKDLWQQLGCVPYDVPVTTTAVVWNQYVLIPSGEIKAGVRTPKLLSARIFF